MHRISVRTRMLISDVALMLTMVLLHVELPRGELTGLATGHLNGAAEFEMWTTATEAFCSCEDMLIMTADMIY